MTLVRLYRVKGSRVFHTRRDCHYLARSRRGFESTLVGVGGVLAAGRCRRCVELDRAGVDSRRSRS